MRLARNITLPTGTALVVLAGRVSMGPGAYHRNQQPRPPRLGGRRGSKMVEGKASQLAIHYMKPLRAVFEAKAKPLIIKAGRPNKQAVELSWDGWKKVSVDTKRPLEFFSSVGWASRPSFVTVDPDA